LLAKENRKRTAWQAAAEWGKTEPLEIIWEWTKAELSTEELNNKLLLAKDDINRQSGITHHCGTTYSC